jgi:YggT family protein
MVGANSALFFLVTTLLELVIWVYWLRLLLQAVRADFYNPISQFVFKATRMPTDPLSKLLPPVRNINLGAALSLFVLGMVFIYAVTALLGIRVGLLGLMGYGSLKLLLMLLGLYTFTLFIQAVMSWIGPGVHNPAANVLWSLNAGPLAAGGDPRAAGAEPVAAAARGLSLDGRRGSGLGRSGQPAEAGLRAAAGPRKRAQPAAI